MSDVEQGDIFRYLANSPRPPELRPGATPRNFKADLARSKEAAQLPIWEEIYRAVFPDFFDMKDYPSDGHHQRLGVDRIVRVCNELGFREFFVDEKIRDFCLSHWRARPFSFDVALEFMSNSKTKAPGWVCKPLACHFIAYAVAPLGQGCLLPVRQLQQAWDRQGDRWRATYGEKASQNKGYQTLFCPVPLAELFGAMGQEYRFYFTALESNP